MVIKFVLVFNKHKPNKGDIVFGVICCGVVICYVSIGLAIIVTSIQTGSVEH